MRRLSGILMGAMLAGVVATPLVAQSDAWQGKWFWGAQAGVVMFKDANGTQAGISAGGHWLITAKRSALWVAFDQMFFESGTVVQLVDASGTSTSVSFTDGWRLQFGLLGVPVDGPVQIYGGVGVAIHDIQDPAPRTAAVEAHTSSAFAMFMGGFQLRAGGNLAVFGHYQLMPGSADFLLPSDMHAFSGGIRVSFGSAHEDVTTRR